MRDNPKAFQADVFAESSFNALIRKEFLAGKL